VGSLTSHNPVDLNGHGLEIIELNFVSDFFHSDPYSLLVVAWTEILFVPMEQENTS
jgi:hypothetical protein